jgi:trk system potassium uptake protein
MNKTRKNLFSLIYAFIFAIHVITLFLFLIIFGTYTNEYFHIVDIVFLVTYVIYFILSILSNPRAILNLYGFALLIIYLWIMAMDTYALPGFEQGLIHQGLFILILVLRGLSVISAIISNKQGRTFLVGSVKFLPAQTFVIGFLLVILIGSLVLSLPVSVSDGESISYIDALFTSTSAVCVTGLIVVDTGSYYSLFGQIVILILIQIGGLGIMTFGSFIAILIGNKISLSSKHTSLEIYDQSSFNTLKALIKTIIVGTFLIELVGAVILFLSIDKAMLSPPNLGYKIYFSIFHSISSFCNAGFSLNANNLMDFTSNFSVNATVMGLIVLGGIGFPIMMNIRNYAIYWLKNRFRKKVTANVVVKLQTKIVIATTVSLILVGTVLFLIFEWNGVLQGDSIPHKIMQSFFQGITPRTAGFNTVDTSALNAATYLLLILLMFIGASPGSTGGGIKTTTYFILFKVTNSIIKGAKDVTAFGKRINNGIINRSIAIFFSYMFLVFLASFILLFTDGFNLLQTIFEVVSAIATVGLSTGITFDLSTMGKIIITLVMFTGRIGVLTFLFVFFRPVKENDIKSPEETVSIG